METRLACWYLTGDSVYFTPVFDTIWVDAVAPVLEQSDETFLAVVNGAHRYRNGDRDIADHAAD